MQVKVSDASGPVLDWLVAKCQGLAVSGRATEWRNKNAPHSYSTDWAFGGPVVQKHISSLNDLGSESEGGQWSAVCNGFRRLGNTALEAAMRSYVVATLKQEIVEVLDELAEVA